MVHWINTPDPEPDLHDHPVSFLSIIVRGGYSELRSDGKIHQRRWWNFIRYTTAHRIVEVLPGTITFCVNGPARREWGYYTPQGRVSWKVYKQQTR